MAWLCLIGLLGLVGCGRALDVPVGTAQVTTASATLVLPGQWQMVGITATDGLLVVTSYPALQENVLDPATGVARAIGPAAQLDANWLMGDVLGLETGSTVDATQTLGIWTNAHGYSALASVQPNIPPFFATDGAEHIAYEVNGTSGDVADLVLDDVTHSSPQTVLTQQAIFSPAQWTADGHWLVDHAPPGQALDVITEYDTTGVGTDLFGGMLVDGGAYLNAQRTAFTAFLGDGSTQVVYDLTTGTSATLPSDLEYAFNFFPDGQSLLANNSDGTLERITWSGGVATAGPPLATSFGVVDEMEMSPDGNYVEYESQASSSASTATLGVQSLVDPTTRYSLGTEDAMTEPLLGTFVGDHLVSWTGPLSVTDAARGTTSQLSSSTLWWLQVSDTHIVTCDGDANTDTCAINVWNLTTSEPSAQPLVAEIAGNDYGQALSKDHLTLYYAVWGDAPGIYEVTLPQ